MNIKIVITIYKTNLNELDVFSTLKGILTNDQNIASQISVTLYDNSKFSQSKKIDVGGLNIEYIHDSRNLGISTAYNYALKAAEKNGEEWLLLLDQDTTISKEFLNELIKRTIQLSNTRSVVAVTPKVFSNNRLISPKIVKRNGRFKDLKDIKNEFVDKEVMAINSGTLLKVSYLNEIGGFNNNFNLDYLDHWLFNRIFNDNKKVYILEFKLKHKLSVSNKRSYVDVERYKSILDAERLYYKKYRDSYSKWTYVMYLIPRTCKQFIFVGNKTIYKLTLQNFLKFIIESSMKNEKS